MYTNTLVVRDSLNLYMKEISTYKLLSQKEEKILAEKWFYEKDRTAAEKLVLSNLRFVVKLAYKFKSYKMKLEDLIQEGNIGLLRGVQTYDPNQNIRLIHYASWWIKSRMQAYILKMWNIVKIGTTQAQRKLFFKLRQTESKILNEHKNSIDLSKKVAKELNLKVEDVEEMQIRISGSESSIDKPINSDNNSSSFSDYLPAKINIEEDFIKRKMFEENKIKLEKALKLLNEREIDILKRRFFNDKKEGYQEIGDLYGISKQRVAQIEKSAIEKMRKQFD
jgi:RNA polymerase sigma-32 factor